LFYNNSTAGRVCIAVQMGNNMGMGNMGMGMGMGMNQGMGMGGGFNPGFNPGFNQGYGGGNPMMGNNGWGQNPNNFGPPPNNGWGGW